MSFGEVSLLLNPLRISVSRRNIRQSLGISRMDMMFVHLFRSFLFR